MTNQSSSEELARQAISAEMDEQLEVLRASSAQALSAALNEIESRFDILKHNMESNKQGGHSEMIAQLDILKESCSEQCQALKLQTEALSHALKEVDHRFKNQEELNGHARGMLEDNMQTLFDKGMQDMASKQITLHDGAVAMLDELKEHTNQVMSIF